MTVWPLSICNLFCSYKSVFTSRYKLCGSGYFSEVIDKFLSIVKEKTENPANVELLEALNVNSLDKSNFSAYVRFGLAQYVLLVSISDVSEAFIRLCKMMESSSMDSPGPNL